MNSIFVVVAAVPAAFRGRSRKLLTMYQQFAASCSRWASGAACSYAAYPSIREFFSAMSGFALEAFF